MLKMFHVIFVKLILNRYWTHGHKNKLENHLETLTLTSHKQDIFSHIVTYARGVAHKDSGNKT